VWNRYQDRTIENQPALWSDMTVLAAYRTMGSRIAEAEVPIQENSYVGGALIFLAAVESQAKHLGATVKKLDADELSPWMKKSMAGSCTDEELASISAATYNTTPDKDLRKLGSASAIEFRAMFQQVTADNAASFESSPFAEEYARSMQKVVTSSFQAATIAVAGFLEVEPHFSSFMNDWGWDNSHPIIRSSEQMGAADMRGLLQSAGVA